MGESQWPSVRELSASSMMWLLLLLSLLILLSRQDGVTFALSGFKNPLRGELRDKGLALGAMYKPQWEKGCTHLM